MKFFMIFLCLITTVHAAPPALQLANNYSPDINIKNYWVSEKYDGVRAYWDGQQLITRQGNIIHAPDGFINALPNTPLDGELWIDRGKFDELSGIIRQQKIINTNWEKIKYMVFDLPASPYRFDVRLQHLKIIIKNINKKHIQLIKQTKISSHRLLLKKLDDAVAKNAEGLMLHLGSSIYKNKRSNDVLKLKKYYDAEAIVIKYIPGKGKFSGMLGSMLVEMPNKTRFKIGSGFSNAERRNPPKIGSTITYKYFGLTSKGKPRFASYMRIKTNY